jgi:iron complex transport system substrate-binding protein
MVRMLGGLIGLQDEAERLAESLQRGLDAVRESAGRFKSKPRVFFEEWDDPLISGIRWVEELVETAGGAPIFPNLRNAGLAKDRIVSAEAVRAQAPDVILASWCGKKVRPATIEGRPGWTDVPAVAKGHIYEIKSTYILQPGPASLTEGVRQVHDVLCRVAGVLPNPALTPSQTPSPSRGRR